MSHSLSRWQAILLGAVVLVAVGLTAVGLVRIGGKQGLWAETVEVTAQFPDAHDISLGTPVRIRGVDAGHVTAIDYPADDGPQAAVTLRMKIDAKYATRLYADASAQVHSTGLLGSKVIAVLPGNPSAGPLVDGRLSSKPTPDLTEAAAKIGAAADEVTQLVHEARTGDGTLAKLLRDDKLYAEITGLAKDSRGVVKRAGDAVGVVEKKADDVDQFVKDGRETLRSVKQGTDAVQSMPIVRGYVTDSAKLLVRPDCYREELLYNATDLFEPNSAILSDDGRQHLLAVVNWLKEVKNSKSEVVIAALCDPKVKDQTPASSGELTRKQAEVVLEHLKSNKALKTGWFSSRKATPLGMGQGPSPVVASKPMPPNYVQVVLFTPQ
jgi:phospholipid/cholesterol/gamma-HCH transport system substrate-binding protein